MFETPCFRELTLCAPDRAVANYAAEHRQHHRRLAVGLEAIHRTAVIGVVHLWGFILVATDAAVGLPLSIEICGLTARIRGRQDVHVLVESFIHPAVPRLIVAHHHWPPLM